MSIADASEKSTAFEISFSHARLLSGVAFILVALIMVFPMGVGGDYPNHLALAHIIHDGGQTPSLAANYDIASVFAPHQAFEALSWPFGGWASPYLYGPIIMSVTLAAMFLVSASFRQNADDAPFWSFALIPALFGMAFHWGFVDFLISSTAALALFRLWLTAENWPSGRRWLVFAPAALVLLAAHLLGLLLLGFLIVVTEADRVWRRESAWADRLMRFGVRTSPLIPATLVMIAIVFLSEGNGSYETSYLSVEKKARFLTAATTFLPFWAAAVCLAGLAMFFYVLARNKAIRIDRRLAPAIIGLAALAVITPQTVLGIWGIDLRFPALALLLLVASVQFCAARFRRAANLVGLVVGAIALVGAGQQLASNHAKAADIRAVLAKAERGASVLSVMNCAKPTEVECLPDWSDRGHMVSYGVIDRGLFNPLLFTPVSFVEASEERRMIDAPYGSPLSAPQVLAGMDRELVAPTAAYEFNRMFWADWPNQFDYILFLRENGDRLAADFPHAAIVAQNDTAQLFSITPRPAGAISGLRDRR